jgi:hypothetical protein
MNCLIWGTPAEDKGRIEDRYFSVISNRTGGGYRLASEAQHLVLSLGNEEKKKLTNWLVQRRRSGEDFPFITEAVMKSIATLPSKRFADRVNDTLLFFAQHLDDFSKQFHLSAPRGDPKPDYLLAITACMNTADLHRFLHLMVEIKLLTAHGSGLDSFGLSANGWERIDQLQQERPSTAQAFVAMWFHPSTEAAYANGIEPAIRDNGYSPLRIDKKEHVNKIDDEIIAEIRRSRFLVADFTCEPKQVRGGVYFEAGFARGLEIPVIWTCRTASIGDLHFDTRQFSHIVWEQPTDLYTELKNRIGALLGQGPLATSS